MSRFETHHEFIDLSKRKPYVCGVCLLDITHEIHQPKLPGCTFQPPNREQIEVAEAARPVAPDKQLAMF